MKHTTNDIYTKESTNTVDVAENMRDQSELKEVIISVKMVAAKSMKDQHT